MCFLNDKDLKTIKTKSRKIQMEKKQYFVKNKQKKTPRWFHKALIYLVCDSLTTELWW